MNNLDPINIDDIIFLRTQFKKITDAKKYHLPSDYIEKTRYLNKELTPIPGYYKFDRTPFWKEPLDNMSPLSIVQKVVVVKGVQIGATTGILENAIAYNIGSDPKPQLYISADKELVKMGMEIKIERMIDSCGLREKIFSQTKGKTKKTGDTIFQKEYPNGFLVAIGAQNPGKLRSMSFPVILFDELDGMPDTLGREGNPVSLADNRTNAYAEKRKILYISTPLVLQTSKIWQLFLRGDQRKFLVPCKHCQKKQELVWHGVSEYGLIYGIRFDVKNGEPDYNSVEYVCRYCGKRMKNHDKALILGEGEWVSSAESKEPGLVSYHISALYSPPGMFSWEKVVNKWSECWDLINNRIKDKEKYREFRNLMQGLPFEERGESIRIEKVKANRSYHYLKNQINNERCRLDSESDILLLTCAVDCQKNNLFAHIIGWTAGGRSYTIDFISIDGVVEDLNSDVWKRLDELLTQKTWQDEFGNEYRIINTFIDSGKYTQYVYEFCKSFSSGVYAIKGDEYINGGLTLKPFGKDTLDRAGLPIAFHLNTTKLKDFISKIFNLQWDTGKSQPEWYSNFPNDMHDDFFRMFTAENRVDEYDKTTNKYLRSRWKLTAGAENHAFDTTAYNLACLEMIAEQSCRQVLSINQLDWKSFWEFAKTGYFYNKKN